MNLIYSADSKTIYNESGSVVADIYGGPEADKLGQLFAASPDMLTALKSARMFFESLDATMQKAVKDEVMLQRMKSNFGACILALDAIIEKAEGHKS